MNIRQIKETCLYVSDLDRAEYFYHNLLGFPTVGRVEGRHVFFKAGSSMLLCFIAEQTKIDTQLPPHYGYGQQHIAFEISPEEYGGWKKDILGKGVTIIHEQKWKEGLYSFYFHDMDGHLLEIIPTGIWE